MATMNFDTSNWTFRQLMGNGLSYRVPPFQRDYSWTEDEWDDLWQDIEGLFEEGGESAHYMGYLVLQSSDSKQFDIIDGQQRITTMSVLILAGLAYLKDLIDAGLDAERNLKRQEQLQNSYIGYLDPVSLIPRAKLSLNRHNDRFYQHYLVPLERIPQRGLHASEHLLRKAFSWFRERFKLRLGNTVESGEGLAKFIDQLVDRLFFTVIKVNDELNAFTVFETLNARGVRLSSTDLLKNYLFSLISAVDAHEHELKTLEERWERIVGLLRSERFPEFLRVYWNSKHKLVRKSELFKTIRGHVQNRQEAFDLLRDLDQCAEIYAALRDAHDGLWGVDEKEALDELAMFSVRQPLAMLMASHQCFFEADRDAFSAILKAVAVISFRYNVICNFQTNEQERLYNAIAVKISSGAYTSADQVLEAIAALYPDDTRFKVAFSEKSLRTTSSRNKKIVRYILFKIERQQSGNDFDPESAKYTLEHILPENPSEAWSHIDEVKEGRLIYRLGNMTLLELPFNRRVGNQGYREKFAAYAVSEFQMTRALAENYDAWDEEKIESRQKRLAKVAAGLWRLTLEA